MQVGDLVKVYHYSHEARKRLTVMDEHNPRLRRVGVDGHYVGLIVATEHIVNDKHRRVLRCVDGELEYYNVNRLEVINASR